MLDAANIDPSLMINYVTRGEYDSLLARYDSLVASISGESTKRGRTARQSMKLGDGDDRSRDGESETRMEEKPGGRKKRSMKLEVSLLWLGSGYCFASEVRVCSSGLT